MPVRVEKTRQNKYSRLLLKLGALSKQLVKLLGAD
jgi:hypothetical protein